MPHVVSLKLMTLNILYKVLEFHVMNFNLKGLCELSRGEHAQTAKAGVDHTTIKTHGKCWLHQPRVYCQGWLHVTCDSIQSCMCNTNSLNMSFNRAINLFFTLELICKCEIQVCQVSVVTVNTHTHKKKIRFCICSDESMWVIQDRTEWKHLSSFPVVKGSWY